MFITKCNVSNGLSGKIFNAASDRTIRSLFEEAGVNVGNGLLQVNGSILEASDLDKTLADVVENPDVTQIIRMTVKANNACKAILTGSAFTIVSSATPEQLRKLKRFHRDALEIMNEKTKTVDFMIDISDDEGCINQYGAVFTNRTDAEGHATVTIYVPADVDAKEYVRNEFGRTMLKINEIESNFANAFAEISNDEESIENMISVS